LSATRPSIPWLIFIYGTLLVPIFGLGFLLSVERVAGRIWAIQGIRSPERAAELGARQRAVGKHTLISMALHIGYLVVGFLVNYYLLR